MGQTWSSAPRTLSSRRQPWTVDRESLVVSPARTLVATISFWPAAALPSHLTPFCEEEVSSSIASWSVAPLATSPCLCSSFSAPGSVLSSAPSVVLSPTCEVRCPSLRGRTCTCSRTCTSPCKGTLSFPSLCLGRSKSSGATVSAARVI